MKRAYKRDDAILAWHWLAADGKTANDYRGLGRVAVERGDVFTVDRPIMACHRGLHASRRMFDAMYYAPGPILCRVRCWGQVDSHRDKIAAQHREVLWMADATDVLRRWACDAAAAALGSSSLSTELVAAARAHVDGTSDAADVRRAVDQIARFDLTSYMTAEALSSAVMKYSASPAQAWSLANRINTHHDATYASINRSLTSALQKLRNAKCAL